MSGNSRPMSNLDWRDCLCPCLDAVEKIPPVSLAVVASRPGKVYFVRPDFSLKQLLRICIQTGSRDMYPSTLADKPHTLGNVVITCHTHHQTVGIFTLKIIIHRRIPQTVFGKNSAAGT